MSKTMNKIVKRTTTSAQSKGLAMTLPFIAYALCRLRLPNDMEFKIVLREGSTTCIDIEVEWLEDLRHGPLRNDPLDDPISGIKSV